jgi:hypothetical protein
LDKDRVILIFLLRKIRLADFYVLAFIGAGLRMISPAID